MVLDESISSLTEELIACITDISPTDRPRIDHLKRWALEAFTDHRLRNTNQFDVNAKLSGLEEKCRVFNNDEVADALHIRMAELSPKPERWLPEILSFLLHFSDNPAQNSKVEDLETLKAEPVPAPLSWADIIAEDPLDNQEGIWDNVDFSADGSDEDIFFEDSPSSNSSSEHGNEIEDFDGVTENMLVPANDKLFTEIVEAQFWKKMADSKEPVNCYDVISDELQSITITETQLVREVIFMLLGLPTTTYKYDSYGSIILSMVCDVNHMSQESVRSLLIGFALIGDELQIIRAWIKKGSARPLLQTFQAALESQLDRLHTTFSKIQARALDPSKPFSPSLLELFDETSQITSFARQITEVVRRIDTESIEKNCFVVLELLYHKTCMNCCVGDTYGYQAMASIFFDCFRTYMKPIVLWMDHGDLSRHNQGFFVKENTEDVASEFFWQKKYGLVNGADNLVYAPGFLHVVAGKILTIGKNINILKRLGHRNGLPAAHATTLSQLDYEAVCQMENLDAISPFSELFNVAVEEWVTAKYQASSQILRQYLESQCGLERHLDALENIYFARNGALSGIISRTIFDRIDRGIGGWNDGFILTELFQRVYKALPSIDTYRLVVRPSADSRHHIQNKTKSVQILSNLRIWYSLPWPIANIIKQGAIEIYQRVFTFITQTRKAKHTLEQLPRPQGAFPLFNNETKQNHLIYSLRHRLLWFANSLLSYLMDIVLSPLITTMRTQIAQSTDMDNMISTHHSFITTLESRSLLSPPLTPIHTAILSLLDLAILFTESSPLSLPISQPLTPTAPYPDHLANMHSSFSSLLAFVVAGLQGVHRAAGEPCWEILAESLAAGLDRR